MGKKYLDTRIRLTTEAYNYLTDYLSKNPEQKQENPISNLIMTFLNAKLEWKETEKSFQIGETQYMLINIPAYIKYLKENPYAKIPLIEALRKIADATTWRKFGEALEKGEQL